MTILEECKEDNSTIIIFTDGSKSEQGVGAGAAIFITGTHTKSLKYRLHERCSINQAEQLTILKSLEYIKEVHTPENTVTVYSDSQTTLRSLKNNRIHTYLIDKMRRQAIQLERTAWTFRFCWVKARARIQGNELADTIAKEAATNVDIPVCYDKIPISVVKR